MHKINVFTSLTRSGKYTSFPFTYTIHRGHLKDYITLVVFDLSTHRRRPVENHIALKGSEIAFENRFKSVLKCTSQKKNEWRGGGDKKCPSSSLSVEN